MSSFSGITGGLSTLLMPLRVRVGKHSNKRGNAGRSPLLICQGRPRVKNPASCEDNKYAGEERRSRKKRKCADTATPILSGQAPDSNKSVSRRDTGGTSFRARQDMEWKGVKGKNWMGWPPHNGLPRDEGSLRIREAGQLYSTRGTIRGRTNFGRMSA